MTGLEFLLRRQSIPSRLLAAPGPDAAQCRALLAAALRVPDHGRLAPFRLLTLTGPARLALGSMSAELALKREPDRDPALVGKDRERFAAAPLIVVVVACISAGHKVPEQEQLLSAGCVAYNLLLGAQALGFGAQWLTSWVAYDRAVADWLGLGADERVIAFVHIGSASVPGVDRPRPDPAEYVIAWQPPDER
ncbi:MAG: nitroreductase [Porticoccaceae bacterium]